MVVLASFFNIAAASTVLIWDSNTQSASIQQSFSGPFSTLCSRTGICAFGNYDISIIHDSYHENIMGFPGTHISFADKGDLDKACALMQVDEQKCLASSTKLQDDSGYAYFSDNVSAGLDQTVQSFVSSHQESADILSKSCDISTGSHQINPSYQLELYLRNGTEYFSLVWIRHMEGPLTCPPEITHLESAADKQGSAAFTTIQGYHSNMHVKLNLTSTRNILIVPMSRDIFVDPFELSSKEYKSPLTILGKPHLEAPANSHLSQNHLVAFVISAGPTDLNVPFHLRYQPVNEIGIHNVTVYLPFLLTCIARKAGITLGSIFPRYIREITTRMLNIDESKAVCNQIKLDSVKSRIFIVPVGNSRDTTHVQILTGVVSLCGVIAIVAVSLFKTKKEKSS